MYNHKAVEKKWQNFWENNKTFKVNSNSNKEKKYILDMFPYPSGAGLHVGHPEGYTATDIYARMCRMQGYEVLHPIGWDAFGLPAEQYAIKTGNDPREFTNQNIETFKRQIKSLGFSYDWDREVNTTDPKYFKWTQWIFKKLFEKGLAEIGYLEVNWCEQLGTVLANEEVLVENGKMVSERGSYPVTKKPMKQWVLKITKYAEQLLSDLDSLDWPESTKEMQRNWIGKSVGTQIDFKIANTDYDFTVFTTRCDTLFGATYCVLAPEHRLVEKIKTKEQTKEVDNYIEFAKSKTDLERTELNKDKTGVFTGAYAVNPVNGKKIPIWIADYVLASYGTGAIMAVPAHDQRDYEFAKKFAIKIVKVLDGDIDQCAFTKDALHVNSEFLNGLDKEEAIAKMIEFLEEEKIGKVYINYKLRDWIFSRQRFWGEPFPVIHYEDGTIELVKDEELPLLLPKMDNIKPSGTGESPLANAKQWLEVVRDDGVKGRRETNTMPQWAGSCWYYLAYIINNCGEYTALDSEEGQQLLKKWLPVDLYIGGAEHSVLHLLYSRFWHKVLYDCGIVQTKEPFQKLFHQGMILGEDNQKMSKSSGNVKNPDEIVENFGADALRLYEMFMGPLEGEKPWSDSGIEGARRFIDRVWRILESLEITEAPQLEKIHHFTIKKVTEDYNNLKFNTAISQMMIYVNEIYRLKKVSKKYLAEFLMLLNPICPHITEEINQLLGNKEILVYQNWPQYDQSKLVETEVEIVIQVNGKVRDKIRINADTSAEQVKKLAITEKIKKLTEGLNIAKIIYVKGKLVSIVVKSK